MKNSNNVSLQFDDSGLINTQQYVDAAHRLRSKAVISHFGLIKNVFKKKSSATKSSKTV